LNPEQSPPSLSYRDAGVDIDAGDALVETHQAAGRAARCVPKCSPASGASARWSRFPSKYREPVLVSGTDGVGTKLKLAFELESP
jgi:phosphoribosylformylglycinamidine cyclo-ligase